MIGTGLAGAAVAAPPARSALATAPDLGSLLAYRDKQLVRERFGVRYAVDVSEAHAAGALAGHALSLRAPNGELLQFAYERHVEHADGNWTWFGRDARGANVVITFGENAVFGTIPQGRRELLLTTTKGQAWLADIDLVAARVEPREPDYRDPGNVVSAAKARDLSQPFPAAAGKADPDTRLDVVIGYSPGVVARYGGESQAITRINYLVDLTNQAMVQSRVTGSVNVRKTLLVNWPDDTDNTNTLLKMSGNLNSIPVDPAFTALRAAREQFGADLVSLIRSFNGAQGSCGMANVIGRGFTPIGMEFAEYAYSVVSDGSDPSTRTYCRDVAFAHEIGHNLGQAHDQANSGYTRGAHLYSYGYRELDPWGIATIMAYPILGQTVIAYYANPLVRDANSGRVTGLPLLNDNAMSMNQTIPLITQFRARVP